MILDRSQQKCGAELELINYEYALISSDSNGVYNNSNNSCLRIYRFFHDTISAWSRNVHRNSYTYLYENTKFTDLFIELIVI